MIEDEGRIGFDLRINDAQLKRDIKMAQEEFARLGNTVEVSGARMDEVFRNVGKTVVGAFTIDKAQEFVRSIVKVRSEVESLERSFEVLAGAVKGKQLFAEIKDFAVKTPMSMSELAKGAQTLLSFNIEAEKVMPILRSIGDISMGDAGKFNSLTLAFSQMSSTGKLMGQDLLQMINAGFNPLSVMAEKTGKDIGTLKDEMSAGAISADMVTQAFMDATSEGGKFHNMLAIQSETVKGSISNLQGAIDDMLNALGEKSQGVISSSIQTATDLVNNYERVGEVIAELIAAYGTYKTVLLATEAIQNTFSIVKHTDEADQLYAVMNAEQQERISKMNLAKTSEEYYLAVKAETQAEMERQTQLAVTTQAELTAARERLTTADAEKAAALENVATKRAELEAVLQEAQTEQTASIQKKIAIESEKQSRMALRAQKLQEQKDAAISQARALKEAQASQEVVAAKNREIATINQKLVAAKAEEVQHSQNIVALRKEMSATVDATSSKSVAKATTALETAEENLNTAAKARNTAAREVSSKSALLDSTVRRANTIETATNTAAQTANATATGFLSVAKTKLTAVASRLNAVLMANPYTLAAAGVAVLGLAIYKLITYQTDAEKAQKRLDEATRECNKSIASEQVQIDSLFARLQAAEKGTDDYKKAKAAIISQYGSYLEGLSAEIKSLQDVEGAYKAVTKAAIEAARARAMEATSKEAADTYAEKETDAKDKLYDALKKKFGNKKGKDGKLLSETYYWQLLGTLNGKTKIKDSFLKQFEETHFVPGDPMTGYGANVYTTNAISDAFNQIKDARTIFDDTMAEAQRRFGDIPQASTQKGENKPKQVIKNKKYWEDYKKEQQGVLDAMTEAQLKTKEAATIRKNISDAQAKIDAYSVSSRSSHSSYGNHKDQASAIEKNEIDVRQLLTENANSRKSLMRELQQQEEQMNIDLEVDAAAKRRRQLALDQQKEQDQLQDQQDAAIKAEIQRQKQYFDAVENTKAVRNKNYVKMNFTDADIDQSEIDKIQKQFEVLFQRLQEQQKRDTEKSAREELKSELTAMADYLKSYGTLQQQKYAIAKEYAEKIREINEGDGTAEEKQWKVKSLEKERDAAVTQTNAKNLAMSIDWGTAFEGVGNVLKDVARETLSKLDEYMRTDEYKKLSAENKKTYTELQNKLRQETGTGSTSPFNFKIWGDISKNVSDYQQSVRTLQERTRAHTKAVEELQQAQNDLTNATDDASKALAQKAVDVAQGKVDTTASAQDEAQEASNKARQTLTDNTNAAAQGIKNFTNYLNEMSNGSLYGFANGMSKLITSLTKGSDGIGKSLNELGGKIGGIVGAILQILDALGDDPKGFIDDLLNKVADIVEQILEDLPEIVITVLKDIGNIIQGVVSGIASWFGADDLFGLNGNEKQVENAINRLTERNELLQDSIEDLTDEIKASKGTKSVAAYRSAYDLQKETNANYLGMAQAQASYWKHHHSWNYYWNGFTDDQTDWIKKNVKGDFNGDIWSLSPEEMKKLRSNVGIWEYIKGTGKGGYGGRVTDKLNDYIDQAGKLEELTNELYEGLTGISFDSMYDSFIDTLMDMDASAADAAEKMSEYFMRAMLSNKIGELYADKLEDWWKKFGVSMEDGELTEEERKSLQDVYMGYVDEAMKLRGELAKATGYDAIASSQDSEKKGFATASQDSIDELNGRFTAVQMDTSVIRGLVEIGNTELSRLGDIAENAFGIFSLSQIGTDTNAIRMSLDDIGGDVSAARVAAENISASMREANNISLMSLSELQDINKNTRELYGMHEALNKMEKHLRKI